jgi:hypothetical protein
LRDTLGIAWEENADRLVDTATFFGGVCHVSHDLFDACADDLNKTGTEGEGSVTVPVFGFYESGTCTTAADPAVISVIQVGIANGEARVHQRPRAYHRHYHKPDRLRGRGYFLMPEQQDSC